MSNLAEDFQRAMHPDASASIQLWKFSPAQIRVAMAELVSQDQLVLADALGMAGLSFYPQSDDILASCALLAEVRQDWQEADCLLGQLVANQGMSATPSTWLHWIRVAQCKLETERALQIAQLAICEHPADISLLDAFDHVSGALIAEQIEPQRHHNHPET